MMLVLEGLRALRQEVSELEAQLALPASEDAEPAKAPKRPCEECGEEVEDYTVNLQGVTALELKVVPHLSGGRAVASLTQLRLT